MHNFHILRFNLYRYLKQKSHTSQGHISLQKHFNEKKLKI